MTNGVFAISKVKVQIIFDSKPRALCKSARELQHFSNTTMSEAFSLLCNNIYQILDVRDENRASLELKHRLDRQRPIWEAF